MSSAGRVAIITGASRGIGRAIALGLARAGWHVVVAAKSTTSTEKLPGSIHTVAAEIEALGAQALPIPVDVREADQIEAMATRTLERFGRIDLLVNNAGALYWAGILDTPPKRFDLVMSVNVRAAFLACRAVLPAMIQQGRGLLINMSPPMDLAILPGRVAYGISKLGMTLLTLGLAEEVRRHNVAVVSLWPATIIESQASINHHLGSPELWRKPDILVDCVLRLTDQEPAEITGQALLDEAFLRSQGVTDFSGYACVPGTEPPPLVWPTTRKTQRIGFVTSAPETLAAYFPTRAEPDFLPTESPFTPDDQIAVEELRRRGHAVSPVIWGDDAASLRGRFDRLIVRSPWDYMDTPAKRAAFVAWIADLDRAGIVVENAPVVLAWLLDKRYLLDLEAVGVSIVPTRYAPPASGFVLTDCYRGPLVVKPAIAAAGAGLVYLETPQAVADFQAEFTQRNREQAYLVQPLLPEIRTAGEWSLVSLGGVYSHAIQKVPGAGSILCHAEQGGSLRFAAAPPRVQAAADETIERLKLAFEQRHPQDADRARFPLLYLRIDVIESSAGVLVSECEGVEPELFFRARPASAKRFADLVESR